MYRSFCFVISVLDTGKVDGNNNGDSDNNGLTCSAMLQTLYIPPTVRFETCTFHVECKSVLRHLWEFNLQGCKASVSMFNLKKK